MKRTAHTHRWLDLSAYNVMAQLAVDSKGNQALLIRPFNVHEDAQISADRAKLLDKQFQGIANQIGQTNLKSQILRDRINILTGQIVRSPAQMVAFMERVFPNGRPLELTLEQCRQHDAIRAAALALQTANSVESGSPLHLPSLNDALPSGVQCRVTGQTASLTLDNQIITFEVPENPTNGDLAEHVTENLKTHLESQKTDDRDALIQRLADLNRRLGQPDQGFWATTLARFEKPFIERWVTEIDALSDQTSNVDSQKPGAPEGVSEPDVAGSQEDAGSGNGDSARDNVQDFEVGMNLAGERLYEDASGIRFRFEGDFKVKEKVRMVPTRSGVVLETAARGMEFLTVEEALAAPAGTVPLGEKIRAAALHQVQPGDYGTWQAIGFDHADQRLEMIVRSLNPSERLGQLQIMNLTHKALKEGEPETVNAQLFRLNSANSLESLGLPSVASEATLKIWTQCGLSVPGSTSVQRPTLNDSDTVGSDTDTQESNDDTQRNSRTTDDPANPVGGGAGDATSVPPNSGAGTGTPVDAESVSAGGRSGGHDGSADGAQRGDGHSVSDSVADRDQSGVAGSDDQRGDVLGGQPESGDGTTGDQLGAPVDAELVARGPSGSGGGLGTGTESAGTGVGSDTQNGAGLGAADGDDRAVSGETDRGDPTSTTAGEPADRRGNTSDFGGQAPVSDESAGESGAADGTADRPVSGPGGTDRGRDGSAVPDGDDATETNAGTTPVGDEPTGADADAHATGDDGERADGRTDWQRFADEQSAGGAGATAPLYLEPGSELRSPAQRLTDNLTALTRLTDLERDGGAVTLEDRQEIAGFTGFGGIHAHMFRTYGAPEFIRNGSKALLDMIRDNRITTAEYNSLNSTILNAHYSHSGIIGPLWEAVTGTGAPLERILEPSCGMLNFKAFLPESARDKVGRFTGVEIDPLTARMAAAVHPDATVINSGFEKTRFPDNFFDAVVSNVPFGDYAMYDPEHPERRSTIHNAFFQKALDKVKPGGVIAFVTSAYVLDGRDTTVRADIMERSHVMGAYRLPNGTFKESTGTEVVTDVIFLQKKGDFTPNYEPLNILNTRTIEAPLGATSAVESNGKWYEPGDMVPFQDINEVYVDHPERVLGELSVQTSQFGPKLMVVGGGTIEEQRALLSNAFSSVPKAIPIPTSQGITAADIEKANRVRIEQSNDLGSLPGALSLVDGAIHRVTMDDDGEWVQEPVTDLPKNAVKRTAAAVAVMLSLSELLEAETQGKESDAQLDARRAEVRGYMEQWEALEQKTKAVFPKKSWKLLQDDPRAQRIQFPSLYDDETRTLKRPDIVNGRTVRPMTDQPTKAPDIETALAISLAYTARISERYMVELLAEAMPDITADAVRQQLVEKNLAYVDPATNELVESSVYLSGNLKPKLDTVRAIVDSAPEFERNLEALEAALPPPLSPSQIKVSLDAFWLPRDVIDQFLSEGLGLTTTGHRGVRAVFDDHNRYWRLEPSATSGSPSMASIADAQSHVTKSRFGTDRADAFKLLFNAFTNTIPKVMDKIQDEPPRYTINAEETLKAQAKYDEIKDAFDRWIFKDASRAQRLCDIYNENHNTTVLYDPDGSHLDFPGMAQTWVPHKHQADFIWRAVSGKNCMTAHCVGAGKTLQLIGTAIRGKQMGRWNKPLIVVPNHMLEQFANDGQSIYPNAKILVMSKADARAANRPAFAAKCAMGDWDMVICTHSVFEKITVPQEFEIKIIDREIEKLRSALNNSDSNAKPKDIEKAIKKLQVRLERSLDAMRKGTENILNMGEMGIDFIGYDEAHYVKNLMVDTSNRIPGVSNSSSNRALNMLIKCQYLRELHDDCRGVMFATGTPISNSVTECYTFTRMLRPDLLEEAGILNFNDWMGLFGEVKHGMEIKPEGGGYQMKSRLSSFKNVPELVKMVRTFIDVKTREDLNLPTPEIEDVKIAAPQSPFMQGFMKYIEARAQTVRNKKKDEEPSTAAELIAADIRASLYRANDATTIDNETGQVDDDLIDEPSDDILLTIATDGRKASLDPRLLHPKFEDFQDSKINACVKNLLTEYRTFDEQKGAQLVFCDFSSPTGNGIFNVYDDIKAKLIKAGVPEDEIAFIHHCKTDEDKEVLFEKVRSGEVRFLLGSTQKMGVGTNVQKRLSSIHELDCPWTPSSIGQRRGRIERYGNSFAHAKCYRYVTVDSFDVFMWETNIRKDEMIRKAMQRPETCSREMDEAVDASFADIQAVATGNPLIREFMDVKQLLDKYKRLKDGYIDQQADLGSRILRQQEKINNIAEYLEHKVKEQNLVRDNTPLALHIDKAIPELSDGPMAVTGGLKNLGEALRILADQCPRFSTTPIGTFGGLTVKFGNMGNGHTLMVERLDGRIDNLRTVNNQMDAIGDAQDLALGGESTGEGRDEFFLAAKSLVMKVRKIGQDNGIAETQDAIDQAKTNLERLHEDQGAPFAYEQEMADTKARYDQLLPEVGDSIDASKELDPQPLVDFARMIHEATGEHADLVNRAEIYARTGGPTRITHDPMARMHDGVDDIDDETVEQGLA